MSFDSNQITWRGQREFGIPNSEFRIPNSGPKDNREIHQAAVKFESIFLKELLKIMRKTVPKSGFLDGGWTEDYYWDMLNQELSDCMSKAGGIGLAQMIYQQMNRSVESSHI